MPFNLLGNLRSLPPLICQSAVLLLGVPHLYCSCLISTVVAISCQTTDSTKHPAEEGSAQEAGRFKSGHSGGATEGPFRMTTRLLVLVSVALLLAAPVAAQFSPTSGTYLPCYEAERCTEGFHQTDVAADGKTLMCCDDRSKWSNKSVCKERFYFTWGCPDGQEVNEKWFSSGFWWKWCCPVKMQ
uniref:Fibronectin type-II domain-containing protein n=1 Tax=Steinernema glaseri TaxID=37863 RepID=A0A1I7ZKA2_9BILA